MLPLTFLKKGEKAIVVKVNGTPDIRQHLMDIGFVPGASLMVISQYKGDVIVNIKDSHFAITERMSKNIMVQN